ncbi:MAG: hypothetical protein M3Y54_18675 [Bacteroidota bacterium]|nr:hypothetical protein [Bacteroidota bacterium]
MYTNAPSRPWPASPAADASETILDLDLPYDYVRVFLPGIKFAQYSVVTDNRWGQQLRAMVPAERLETVWGLLERFEAVPLEQPLTLRLPLADAMDLHLAAHLGGITTMHDAWDEILAHLRRGSAQRQSALAAHPAPAPGAPTMRQEVAMVSAKLAEHVEEVFGADAPPLLANRALAAELIDSL